MAWGVPALTLIVPPFSTHAVDSGGQLIQADDVPVPAPGDAKGFAGEAKGGRDGGVRMAG